MDRLDKISIFVIIALLITSFVLATVYKSEAGPDRERNLQKHTAAADQTVRNGELDNKIKVIKSLMEADNLGKAEILARELMQQFPHEGDPHMLMGDIFMRRQQLLDAMPEYKEAIDLDPDYLDKKTPLFQGKKIKSAVREASVVIEHRIKAKPDEGSIKEQRKTIYYLERRIAGSCG